MPTPLEQLVMLFQQSQAAPQAGPPPYQGPPAQNPVLTASNPIDPRVLAAYKKQIGYMGVPLENKAELMKAIDLWSRTASRRSPGADYDANGGYRVAKLREALSAIHGINNYTPQGFIPPQPMD